MIKLVKKDFLSCIRLCESPSPPQAAGYVVFGKVFDSGYIPFLNAPRLACRGRQKVCTLRIQSTGAGYLYFSDAVIIDHEIDVFIASSRKIHQN